MSSGTNDVSYHNNVMMDILTSAKLRSLHPRAMFTSDTRKADNLLTMPTTALSQLLPKSHSSTKTCAACSTPSTKRTMYYRRHIALCHACLNNLVQSSRIKHVHCAWASSCRGNTQRQTVPQILAEDIDTNAFSF